MNKKVLSWGFFIIITFIWLPVVFWMALNTAPMKMLGDTAKTIFFHVPTAWITVFAFLISAFYSAKILYGISKKNANLTSLDVWAASAAEIGFVFAILATVTGSIWAKRIWLSYWNWDPRETSIFILLIIYAAYFALRSSIHAEHDKIRLSAVYSLFAFFTVPFFIFIIPRIYESLHPDTLINAEGEIHLDLQMRLIFFSSLFGFTVFFWYLLKLKVKLQLLMNQKEELLEDLDE